MLSLIFSYATMDSTGDTMTDDARQLLKDLIVLLVGGVIGFISQHWRRPQVARDEHEDYQNKTIQTQGKTLSDAFNEIDELRTMYRQSERRQKVQWVYIIKLLEGYREKGMVPPEPPDELKTDPEIIRFINQAKNDKTETPPIPAT